MHRFLINKLLLSSSLLAYLAFSLEAQPLSTTDVLTAGCLSVKYEWERYGERKEGLRNRVTGEADGRERAVSCKLRRQWGELYMHRQAPGTWLQKLDKWTILLIVISFLFFCNHHLMAGLLNLTKLHPKLWLRKSFICGERWENGYNRERYRERRRMRRA